MEFFFGLSIIFFVTLGIYFIWTIIAPKFMHESETDFIDYRPYFRTIIFILLIPIIIKILKYFYLMEILDMSFRDAMELMSFIK